jgi:hypothetical protein
MCFKENLYLAMSEVFPEISVRSFSKALGKSDGYWSSIIAQRLSVTDGALIHLNDYLECQKILLEANSSRLKKIDGIQEMIAHEIVRRFKVKSESLDKISREIANEFKEDARTSIEGPLPFVVYRGY